MNVLNSELQDTASKLKAALALILKRNGYIKDFVAEGKGTKKVLKIELKYAGNRSVITGLRRISRPGRRSYVGAKDRPRICGGIGMTILSTSRGLMTNIEARKQNVGGEILCSIW